MCSFLLVLASFPCCLWRFCGWVFFEIKQTGWTFRRPKVFFESISPWICLRAMEDRRFKVRANTTKATSTSPFTTRWGIGQCLGRASKARCLFEACGYLSRKLGPFRFFFFPQKDCSLGSWMPCFGGLCNIIYVKAGGLIGLFGWVFWMVFKVWELSFQNHFWGSEILDRHLTGPAEEEEVSLDPRQASPYWTVNVQLKPLEMEQKT